MAFLPLAVGAVTGGLVASLATPLAGVLGNLAGGAMRNRNCVLAYDGIEILAPLMVPVGEDFGMSESYIERHPQIEKTTHYRLKFEVIRI
jgi:hypothetical protein